MVVSNGIAIYDNIVTVTEGNETLVSASAALGALDVTVTQAGLPVVGV